VGYYEIDDIIFFPSDDLLKEQGSIIKLRRTPKTILWGKLLKSLKVTTVNFRTIYIESDVNAIEVTIKSVPD
jgi:hypothetical protein